jgi:PAS domain S-box-containing protein
MISQAFTIVDTSLRLVAWNRAFIDLLEFPPALVSFGMPFEAFMRYNAERGEYGPGDPEVLARERVKSALSFKPHYFERVRTNGRIIAVRGEPLPGRGFVTIYSDITEQRQIERLIRDQNAELERRVAERTAAMARSEERLRLITDAIPAQIASFDRERVYRFANRGFADWFGRSKSELVGEPLADVLGESLYAELLPHVDQALAGQRASYEYTIERDGVAHHASSTLVPELEPDGSVSGAFVLSFDVTAQKRAQEALLQAQQMEAVGQLSGGLAHDFNNLLTVVIGNLAVLQERLAGQPALQEFVEPALLASRRGSELVRRLLTFARQQSLAPRAVDIDELVRGLEMLLRRSLPESVTLRIDLPPIGAARVVALADPHQLENALLNLALNARDAMSGGGILTISVAAVTLAKAAADELDIGAGDYVRVAVADTGVGMDAATLAHAFEPFFTTKGLGLGSGLGLSMAHGFARQSGGALRLTSAPDRGTEAALMLPQYRRAEPAENSNELPEELVEELLNTPGRRAPPGARPLVLLVEDDADVRRVVRLQLTELGYPVVEAQDGNEALRLLDAIAEVGLVVSDMVMPGGLDGRQLAERVAACRPGVPVLLMSGYARDMPEGSGGELLAKPFSRDDLARALARLQHE